MQVGSIDIEAVDYVDKGLSADAARVQRTPVEAPVPRPAENKSRETAERAQNSVRPTQSDLEKLLQQINESVEACDVQLRFSINKEAPNQISVKLINTKTHEVIREIPPHRVSALGSKVLDAIGIIIDELI